MALRPRFRLAAQQAQQEQQNPGSTAYTADDVEAVKGMARLFAELGESYTALIATGQPRPVLLCLTLPHQNQTERKHLAFEC